MGFSVSGSAALIFAGLIIAFGMWHSAATESFERVTDAREAATNDDLEQRSTEIVIDSVRYDANADTLTVEVNNTGANAVSLSETDVIVDNRYETNWQDRATVAGSDTTDLWLPGETLTVLVNDGTEPNRVRIATEHGVADAEVVT